MLGARRLGPGPAALALGVLRLAAVGALDLPGELAPVEDTVLLLQVPETLREEAGDVAPEAPGLSFLQIIIQKAGKAKAAAVDVQANSDELDTRIWLAVCAVPFLLWVSTSDRTGMTTIGLSYMAASLAMNVLNKEAATMFRATFLLVIVQMLVSDVVILLMEYRRITYSNWVDVLKWMVVPVAFAGMLSTSIWALKEATLSAVLILKNFLPIISFVAEKFLFDMPSTVSVSIVMSLVVTFCGSVVYGYREVSVSNLGKVLIIVNCLFTLMDRLVQTHFLKRSKDFSVSLPLCMILNNTLGIVPLAALALATGEVYKWPEVVASTGGRTWFWVIMSSGCGACLGYVGLRLQKLVSGTTVLMMQNLNKIVLLLIGVRAFGDQFHMDTAMGSAISIVGCMWYSYLRIPGESKDKTPAPAPQQAGSEAPPKEPAAEGK